MRRAIPARRNLTRWAWLLLTRARPDGSLTSSDRSMRKVRPKHGPAVEAIRCSDANLLARFPPHCLIRKFPSNSAASSPAGTMHNFVYHLTSHIAELATWRMIST